MRLSEFRQLWRCYKDHEVDPPELADENTPGHKQISFKIGKVVFEDFTTPTFAQKEIELHLLKSKSYSDFAIARLKDDTFMITVTARACEYYSDTLFKACIAHEIGHYTAGHLFPGNENKDGFLFAPKRDFHIESYKKSPTDEGYFKAHSETMKAILRGAILRKEIEADIYANKFVPKQDIINCHSVSMREPNPFASLEKRNRIDYIAKNFSVYPERPEGYFKLEIHFDTGSVI